MNLANTLVVVTGGGTGIGGGIAVAFAGRGAKVVICGRRHDVLEKLAASTSGGGSLVPMVLDVTDRAAIRAAFSRIEREHGPIDILVNSAGTNIKTRLMAEMTPEQWDAVMSANATGVYNCMYAVLPAMRKRHAGTIINISSVAGKRANPAAGIAYSASKFAVTALGTSVGQEEAPNGIRITNVYPGEVDTPILKKRPVPSTDAQRAAMLKPADVGELVVSIASLGPNVHVPEVVIKPLGQIYT